MSYDALSMLTTITSNYVLLSPSLLLVIIIMFIVLRQEINNKIIAINKSFFPIEMFTVLFALGRAPGWLAQWIELVTDPEQRIARPRQIYTGSSERAYIPRDQR